MYCNLFSQTLKKTQVLILGTPHLDQLENFKTQYLKRVLDTLQKEKFEVVAVESMPQVLLFDIKNRKESYWQELFNDFNKFIKFGQAYQTIANLSFESARKNIKELNLKTNLSNEDRINIINSFVCTYDLWSATLHYKQLTDKSQLSKTLIDYLDTLSNSKNEINTLALEIAKSNNLSQIYYVDDLQDETILYADFPEFSNDYQTNEPIIKEIISQSQFYKKVTNTMNDAILNKDLYPLYKFFNSQQYMIKDFEGQWALWLRTNFKSKTDRSRFSLWEMRNLLISANILRVIASNPEKRILVIIGASHKSFIEKYLNQIQDIELLQF